MKKKTIWTIVLILSIACLAFSGFFIIKDRVIAARSQREAEELARQMEEERLAREAEEAAKAADEEARRAAYKSPIDFESLWQINPDIVGWIKVDGTNIDYPLLYHETDNSFYLKHNYQGKSDSQGSIYFENYNARELTDFNTIIYGHSLLNGNMFRSLHNFKEKDFFNAHDSVIIYLPKEERHYTVFECETVSDQHILSLLNNYNEESRQEYLKSIFGNSRSDTLIRDGVEVTTKDKMITMSTCKTDKTKRLVVHAVLTEVIDMAPLPE